MKKIVLIILCLSFILPVILASCVKTTAPEDTPRKSSAANADEQSPDYPAERSAPVECAHSWVEATCMEPKTCSKCGKTEGSALGHAWSDATCESPKSCSRCGAVGGSALGHSWTSPTCTSPKTCSRCGAVGGSALGHSWTGPTCTSPKTCSRCGTTEGYASGHSPGADLYCTVCGIYCTAEDFGYLAGADFRSVRRQYSEAVAEGAFVIVYTNLDGDNCVLTKVCYKIIDQYFVTTLHNLTQGTTFENPMDYYSQLGDRYYGADKLHYMDMAIEAGQMEQYALDDLQSAMASGGTCTMTVTRDGVEIANGAYVDADTLNK